MPTVPSPLEKGKRDEVGRIANRTLKSATQPKPNQGVKAGKIVLKNFKIQPVNR